MIPCSQKVDWKDPAVGSRMHLMPYSVLSDETALGVEVYYERGSKTAGRYIHGSTIARPCVTINCGSSRASRRHTFWHEIGHVLDFSQFDAHGLRDDAPENKYSHFLEPQLEFYKDVINIDWERYRNFEDMSPPDPLTYDWYAAGGEDPIELFARLIPLVVLYPMTSKSKMPDLHEEVVKILYLELALTRIPRETINRFRRRLVGAGN